MFRNIAIALKEGLEADPLIGLAMAAAPAPAQIHLVTLIRIGTDEDELERIRQTEEHLQVLAEGLKEQGYDASYEVGAVGLAAAADFLRIAEGRASDLIVIGLAKRTRVAKALMGSDAQRILLSASCPVLVKRLY